MCLVNKLEESGIRKLPLKLFESYLSQRRQVVVLDFQDERCISWEASVLYSIVQGTILGPLLFVIYTDDLPTAIREEDPMVVVPEHLDTFLFADETNVIVTARNVESLSVNIKKKMVKIQNWCMQNKLNLNIDITSIVIFSSNRSN